METANEREASLGGIFGEHLRELRTARRLSVVQAAAAAGVSRRTWTGWEAGRSRPRRIEARSALQVVGAAPHEAARAIALLETPWAVREQTAQAASMLRVPAPAPTGGVLLGALRRRSGLTLESVASRVGVRPSTVHRWEKSVHAPPADQMDTLLRALGAQPEERLALMNGGAEWTAGGRAPAPLEELEARTMDICNDACHGAYMLMDLRFLALEADLWPLAARQRNARWTLAQVFTWHGMWLCWRGRVSEAGAYADGALELMGREFTPTPSWSRPMHVSVMASLHHGTSPMGAVKRLSTWLPQAPVDRTPEYRAWMLRDISGLLSRAGSHDAAVRVSDDACAMAATALGGYEENCARTDAAEVLCRAGRWAEALNRLPPLESYHAGVPAQVARQDQLRAEALLALNDRRAAAEALREAYRTIERFHLTHCLPATDALASQL